MFRSGTAYASNNPTATHFGPYDKLGDAHREVVAWCQRNGHTLAGPSWEVYGHWQDEWNRDPSRIRTDVYHLIASDAAATA